MPEWKIGLLPLYLKLYDDVSQESRPRMQDFVDAIAGVFSARGIAVEKSGICRIEPEFESAVTGFESA
jgi:hypothetical protein